MPSRVVPAGLKGMLYCLLMAANGCGSTNLANDASDVSGPNDAAEGVSKLEAIISSYRGWQPHTAEPIGVSSEIFTLCRLPTLAENEFTDSEHGGQRLLMDWLNPRAHSGFAQGAVPFAPGAAIVKEKLVRRADVAGLSLVALGIMLKHTPGFDPEHGDWEFGYWEEAPGLMVGATQSAYCAECHAGSPTDFVFLDASWRRGE